MFNFVQDSSNGQLRDLGIDGRLILIPFRIIGSEESKTPLTWPRIDRNGRFLRT
jgi:hypothetical protein